MKKLLLAFILLPVLGWAGGISPSTSKIVRVESAWTRNLQSPELSQSAWHPAILDAYPYAAFRDISNTDPRKSTSTAVIDMICDPTVATQIQLDTVYRVISVQDISIGLSQ